MDFQDGSSRANSNRIYTEAGEPYETKHNHFWKKLITFVLRTTRTRALTICSWWKIVRMFYWRWDEIWHGPNRFSTRKLLINTFSKTLLFLIECLHNLVEPHETFISLLFYFCMLIKSNIQGSLFCLVSSFFAIFNLFYWTQSRKY